jgi:hypothetical protein
MKQFFLLFTAFVTALAGYGQVTFTGAENTTAFSPEILKSIDVEQSAVLTDLLGWHISNNKSNKQIEGFRVEIFFSSDADAKEKALKKKVEFLTLYPDNTVHIKYIAPNFRVRVGDFRTKNEALKLFREIKSTYPLSFIVTDNIDFPLMKPLQYE